MAEYIPPSYESLSGESVGLRTPWDLALEGAAEPAPPVAGGPLYALTRSAVVPDLSGQFRAVRSKPVATGDPLFVVRGLLRPVPPGEDIFGSFLFTDTGGGGRPAGYEPEGGGFPSYDDQTGTDRSGPVLGAGDEVSASPSGGFQTHGGPQGPGGGGGGPSTTGGPTHEPRAGQTGGGPSGGPNQTGSNNTGGFPTGPTGTDGGQAYAQLQLSGRDAYVREHAVKPTSSVGFTIDKRLAAMPDQPKQASAKLKGYIMFAEYPVGHVSPDGGTFYLYDDPLGNCTIGYGHLVHYGRTGTHCDGCDAKEAPFLAGVSKTTAGKMLDTDLTNSAAFVHKYVNTSLSEQQFDALVDLYFQYGWKAFFTKYDGKTFSGPTKLTNDLNTRNFTAVPGDILGTSSSPRRGDEVEMWSNGNYPRTRH